MPGLNGFVVSMLEKVGSWKENIMCKISKSLPSLIPFASYFAFKFACRLDVCVLRGLFKANEMKKDKK